MAEAVHVDERAAALAARIRDVDGFPTPGVVFKDITPILGHGPSFRDAITAMVEPWADRRISMVVGIEARGFVLGAPVADRLGAGFVPLRKPGKLPHVVLGADYGLEYGLDRLEAHADSLVAGDRVLIIDDVLATGGTASAAVSLVRLLGGDVVGIGFLLELGFLGGRAALPGLELHVVMGF
jgi:adenine phosphoribosyltransferase